MPWNLRGRSVSVNHVMCTYPHLSYTLIHQLYRAASVIPDDMFCCIIAGPLSSLPGAAGGGAVQQRQSTVDSWCVSVSTCRICRCDDAAASTARKQVQPALRCLPARATSAPTDSVFERRLDHHVRWQRVKGAAVRQRPSTAPAADAPRPQAVAWLLCGGPPPV